MMIDWDIPPTYSYDVDEWGYRNQRERNILREAKIREAKAIQFGTTEEKTKMRKLNKFYVGAEHISRAIASNRNDEWTCKSEADAIAHAKQILENDPTKEVAIVVEVKYIIRRTKPAPPPLKVERVK